MARLEPVAVAAAVVVGGVEVVLCEHRSRERESSFVPLALLVPNERRRRRRRRPLALANAQLRLVTTARSKDEPTTMAGFSGCWCMCVCLPSGLCKGKVFILRFASFWLAVRSNTQQPLERSFLFSSRLLLGFAG